MKRVLKKGAYALLVAVVLVAGLLTWVFNDDNLIRNQVEQYFKKSTGRSLVIGALDIDWGTRIRIQARDVHLSNADWGVAKNFASVDRLDATLFIDSFLNRKIEITNLEIDRATLNLQENDAGLVNWKFFQSEDRKATPDNRSIVPWTHIRISDFVLTHISPERTVPLDFGIDDFVANRSEEGEVVVDGQGVVGGQPLSVRGALSPLHALIDGGPMSHELSIQLGEIHLASKGSTEDASTGSGGSYEGRLNGPDFRWLLEQAALPIVSSGAFDVDIALRMTDNRSFLLDIDGDLGTLNASVDGELDQLFNPGRFNFDFDVDGPDLKNLGRVFDLENLPASGYRISGSAMMRENRLLLDSFLLEVNGDVFRVSGEIGAWPGLKSTALDVFATGEDFGAWGPAIGLQGRSPAPFTLVGMLSESNGKLRIDGSRFTLAESSLELNGTLGIAPDLMDSNVAIRLETPDLNVLTKLFKIELSEKIPLSFNSQIKRDARGIHISQGLLIFDAHKLALEGLVGLQPGVILPGDESWLDNIDSGQFTAVLTTQSAESLGALFGIEQVPDWPFEATVSGTLQKGDLDYKVILDQPEHIQMDIIGRIPRSFKTLGITAQFQAELTSLSFVELFTEAEGLADQPTSFKGELLIKEDVLTLSDIDGRVGAGSFSFSGSMQREPAFDLRDIEFSVSGPDVGMFVVDKIPQGIPRQFSLSGEIRNENDISYLESLSLVLGQTEVEISGTVDSFFDPGFFDLHYRIISPDPSEFESFLDTNLGLPPPPGPLNVDFNLSGTPEKFEIKGIQSGFGDSRVTGRLDVSLEDAPEYRGGFYSEHIDLSWLLDGDPDPETQLQPEEEGTDADSTRRDRMFSDEPLRFLTLDPVNLDLDFHADSLILDTVKLADVDVGLRLTDESLELRPVRMKDSTGQVLSAEMSVVDNGGQLTAKIHGSATGIRLGLFGAEGQPLSALPPWDFFVDLDMVGATPHELAVSAEGQVKLIIGEGKALKTRLNLLSSDLGTELFSVLNPFDRASEYTVVDCGVAEISFTAGEAQVVPLFFQTDKMVIASTGKVNMNDETLNFGFRTRPRRGLGLSASSLVNPFIRVGGTLSRPALALNPSEAAITSGAAVATGGLSILGQSLFNRFLRERDPCGKVVEELRNAQ